MAAEVHATHPADLIEMGKGSFEPLTAEPQQAQPTCATNPPPIAVNRVASRGSLLPVPLPTIAFGEVTADADGFEVDE